MELGCPHSRPYPCPPGPLCSWVSTQQPGCGSRRPSVTGRGRRASALPGGDCPSTSWEMGPFLRPEWGSDEERPTREVRSLISCPGWALTSLLCELGRVWPQFPYPSHKRWDSTEEWRGALEGTEDSAQSRLWAVEGAPGWEPGQLSTSPHGCFGAPAGPHPLRAWVV